MSEIEVKVANEEELKKWDEFVNTSQDGTIFHKLDWLKAAEEHSYSRHYPLIGYNGQEVIGIFPIFYKKKALIKTVFSPPPKCAIPYMGPIIKISEDTNRSKEEKVYISFIQSALEFIEDNFNPDYILIKTTIHINDCRPFKWKGYTVDPVYTYLINIGDITKIWNGFNNNIRRSIKKINKLEISFREGSKSDLLYIQKMMAERYREQQLKYPISKEYLYCLWEVFNNNGLKVFVAEKSNKIISGIIVTIFNGKISFWSGSPKTTYKNIVINDWIHWEIIKWALQNEISFYDLIGANTPRICEYKRKMSPLLCQYFMISKKNIKGKIGKEIYNKIMR